MRFVLIGLVLLMSAVQVRADAEVAVTSNMPAQVIYDGEQIGEAPLKIRSALPGFHQVNVVTRDTGESQIFEFYSPRGTSLSKNVDAVFGQAPVQPPPDYQVAPVNTVAPPAVVEQQTDRSYEEGRRYEQERQKVRTRNTLLGLGVLNEVFNRGKGKKAVRGVALGGALLNELLGGHRDR